LHLSFHYKDLVGFIAEVNFKMKFKGNKYLATQDSGSVVRKTPYTHLTQDHTSFSRPVGKCS